MGYGKMNRFDFSFDHTFRRVLTWIASQSTFIRAMDPESTDKLSLGDGCEGATFLTSLSCDDFARSSRHGREQTRPVAIERVEIE